jgi:redox-sensing transcriptional repressor
VPLRGRPVRGAGREERWSPTLPEVAIKRLPVYLRALGELAAAGAAIVSSAELAERTGLTSEQIRKDLAMLGGFGTRGVGYRIDLLASSIRGVLGLDHEVLVALVGAGHLGTAFARYNHARRQQPRIGAIFDADPSKVGEQIGGNAVRPMTELADTVRRLGIRLAIIAVPAPAAQEVADRLVAAGCDVLLNFAPVRLSLPAGVRVQNVDLAMELEALAYYVRADLRPGRDAAGEGRHDRPGPGQGPDRGRRAPRAAGTPRRGSAGRRRGAARATGGGA